MGEESKQAELRRRTKEFAMQTICLCRSIPEGQITDQLVEQLVRSGTSVGVHLRTSRRAKSRAEFITKLEFAVQELSEAKHWLKFVIDNNITSRNEFQNLFHEATDLVTCLIALIHKTKNRAA
jgi:four helix bundle protein